VRERQAHLDQEIYGKASVILFYMQSNYTHIIQNPMHIFEFCLHDIKLNYIGLSISIKVYPILVDTRYTHIMLIVHHYNKIFATIVTHKLKCSPIISPLINPFENQYAQNTILYLNSQIYN